MISHGVHLLFAALLFASVFGDVFFLRSYASFAIQPLALIKRWRLLAALSQMLLFTVTIGFGLAMWLPAKDTYPSAIFHSKLGLSVVFLIIAKIRVLKERKSDVPEVRLTRILALLLLIIFCLGIVGGLHIVT